MTEKQKSEMDKEQEVETTETKEVETTDQKTLTLEDALAELENLRKQNRALGRENAERRNKLKTFEEAEAQRAEAEKTELQKAKDRVALLEKQLSDQAESMNKQAIRHSVEITAARLGFSDPADAFTLADLSEVEITDDGKVKGVEAALKSLLEKKPYLKGTETTETKRSPELDARKRNSLSSTPAEEILVRKRSEYGSL